MSYLIISYLCNWHTYMSGYAISYYYISIHNIAHKTPCMYIYIYMFFSKKETQIVSHRDAR